MVNKLFLLIIIFLLGSFLLIGAPEGVETLEIGAKAPDFSLKGVDGEIHSLSDYDDSKILVIIFTANHCPTAQAYEGRMKKMAADYKDEDVQVVAISSNAPDALRLDEMGYTDLGDTYYEMKMRAEHMDFNFPYLYDGDKQEAAKAYGPMATPHVFIFDQSRKLRYVGRFDNSEHIEKVTSKDARNAIEALLEGKEVPVKKTRVFGCSMKWAYKSDKSEQIEKQWENEPVKISVANIDSVQKIIENNSDDLRLINFWATWCGPCRVEFPDLVKVNYMYRNRNFEFITISLDTPENRENVLDFLQKQNASNRNYIFKGDKYKLMDKVDPEWPGSIPYTILIAPQGNVIFRKVGAFTNTLNLRREIVNFLGRTYQ